MPNTNEALADALILHRVRLQRFEGGAVRDSVRAYRKATDPILAKLTKFERQLASGKPLSAAQRNQIVRLRQRLGNEIRKLRKTLNGGIQQSLFEAGIAESKATTRAFAGALPVDELGNAIIDVKEITDAAVRSYINAPIRGLSWVERMDSHMIETYDAIDGALSSAISEGASMDNTVRLLQAATNKVNVTKNELVTLARTEIQRVSNRVAQQTYTDNSDVVGGVQYLAVLDSRTCLICAPFHNQVFDMTSNGEHAGPDLPQHPRCRCFYAPVVKSWQELDFDIPPDERRMVTGRPSEHADFGSWLKRQSKAEQIEFFGDELKRDLWKSGELKLSGFADNGKLLRVSDLRALYDQ